MFSTAFPSEPPNCRWHQSLSRGADFVEVNDALTRSPVTHASETLGKNRPNMNLWLTLRIGRRYGKVGGRKGKC